MGGHSLGPTEAYPRGQFLFPALFSSRNAPKHVQLHQKISTWRERLAFRRLFQTHHCVLERRVSACAAIYSSKTLAAAALGMAIISNRARTGDYHCGIPLATSSAMRNHSRRYF